MDDEKRQKIEWSSIKYFHYDIKKRVVEKKNKVKEERELLHVKGKHRGRQENNVNEWGKKESKNLLWIVHYVHHGRILCIIRVSNSYYEPR